MSCAPLCRQSEWSPELFEHPSRIVRAIKGNCNSRRGVVAERPKKIPILLLFWRSTCGSGKGARMTEAPSARVSNTSQKDRKTKLSPTSDWML